MPYKTCSRKTGWGTTTTDTQTVVKTEQQHPSVNNTPTRQVKREITCFTCQQKGHKSPQCPQRQNQVKRIHIPSDKVIPLKKNELFGFVGAHRMPVTCDLGADISVVPEECVEPHQFTGRHVTLTRLIDRGQHEKFVMLSYQLMVESLDDRQ